MAYLSNPIIRSTLDNLDREEPISVFTSNLPIVLDRLFKGEIPNVPMETFKKFYNRYKDVLSEEDKVKLYAASFRSFMLDDNHYERPEEPDLSWMTTKQIKKGIRLWRKHEWDGFIDQKQYDDIEDVIDEELDERDHKAFNQSYIEYENQRDTAREVLKYLPKEIQDKIIEDIPNAERRYEDRLAKQAAREADYIKYLPKELQDKIVKEMSNSESRYQARLERLAEERERRYGF